MLCAQEHSLFAMWTKHHIVAEYLNEHHVKILMFCDIVVNDGYKAALQQRYCELHNLNVFPAPFVQKPTPPAAPKADQDGLQHIRGGGGEDKGTPKFARRFGIVRRRGIPPRERRRDLSG